MRKIFTPIADSTIYQQFDWKNTGADEVLEIGKSSNGYDSIRALIKFDTSIVSSSLVQNQIPLSASFDLKFFVARADDLIYNQSIEIYEVSESWVEGTGYFYQNTNVPYTSSRAVSSGFIQTDGTTWVSRESGSLWTSTGSKFISSISTSTILSDPIADFTLDVTRFIQDHLSSSVPNNGWLLKFPTSDELNRSNIGSVRVFSRNTHTVYVPQLIAKWDDQIFITGSISASADPSLLTIITKNLRPQYDVDSLVRINLVAREEYPVRTFDTRFTAFGINQRLPSSSYFSVIDNQSNTAIIPFDEYSKISCDGNNSYIKFYAQGMYPGRHYQILIRVVDEDSERTFTIPQTFTVRDTR